MKLKDLQRDVYRRRKLENLNILYVNSELTLMGELFGILAMQSLNFPHKMKELKQKASVENFNSIVENSGWAVESCLALSAMLSLDPDRFPEYKVRFMDLPENLKDYLTYFNIEYGALNGIFRKARHKDTTKFESRDTFTPHLARLTNYSLDLLNALEVNPEIVLKTLLGQETNYGGIVHS